ncbi:MAG: hypothetical protein HQM15_07365 [Deltaproteobacteria bacterium]|nr:hypothetical protein [Deltaproteobacteria bacterium]
MNPYLLVMDTELKDLVGQLASYHPEGSKKILKLVLKLYLKLLDKSKRKGRDPILALRDLVEKITESGSDTAQDKISQLDALMEAKTVSVGNYENTPIFEDIREIKNVLRNLHVGGVGGGNTISAPKQELDPSEAAKLVTLVEAAPVERKNYKSLRMGKSQRKIQF